MNLGQWNGGGESVCQYILTLLIEVYMQETQCEMFPSLWQLQGIWLYELRTADI